jgi:hypothetical protein
VSLPYRLALYSGRPLEFLAPVADGSAGPGYRLSVASAAKVTGKPSAVSGSRATCLLFALSGWCCTWTVRETIALILCTYRAKHLSVESPPCVGTSLRHRFFSSIGLETANKCYYYHYYCFPKRSLGPDDYSIVIVLLTIPPSLFNLHSSCRITRRENNEAHHTCTNQPASHKHLEEANTAATTATLLPPVTALHTASDHMFCPAAIRSPFIDLSSLSISVCLSQRMHVSSHSPTLNLEPVRIVL